MKILTEEIKVATHQELAFLDITDLAKNFLANSGVQNGWLHVSTQHTTTAVVINEKEEELQKDMARFLSRLAPGGQDYDHDKNTVDGRINAHSHLQSLLLPSAQTVPVVKGSLKLGTWQKIFFVELDGPRAQRLLTLQVMGE